MKTINIDGNEYPCRVTMGAMLRFRSETGKDVGELGQADVADLITLLWCCVASACAADHVSFGMSLMDFADALAPEDLTEFHKGMKPSPGNEAAGDAEKKTGQPAS